MDMRTIIIFFLQHCGVMYVFLNRNQEGLRVWLPSEFLFSFFFTLPLEANTATDLDVVDVLE